MRAIQRTRPGTAELREVANPEPGADDVRVEVLYAGVNPFDMQVLRGEIGPDPAASLTLGAEATGLVDGVLVQVSGGGVGAVRDGTFAEVVVAPASAVRELPADADPAKAATVGVAGKTAWRAVRQLAEVGPEDRVLVLGASGGVGMFAAQLARGCGAEVLAHTGNDTKAKTLADLGLDAVTASSPADLRQQVEGRGISVVLDPLGGDYFTELMPVLAPRARVVTYGVLAGRSTQLDLARLYGMGLTIMGTSGGTTPPAEAAAALDGALAAVLQGDVVVEAEVLPLQDAPEAFDRLTRREVTGKLLLRP